MFNIIQNIYTLFPILENSPKDDDCAASLRSRLPSSDLSCTSKIKRKIISINKAPKYILFTKKLLY